MNFKIYFIFILSIFFLPKLTGQEIENISLEYQNSLHTKNTFVKIELVKNENEFILYNTSLDKKDLNHWHNQLLNKRGSSKIDANAFAKIKKMIEQFDLKATKKILGYKGIQDPRIFTLQFGNNNNLKIYESTIGNSFRTKDYELKAFNEICKEILKLADYKWRRFL